MAQLAERLIVGYLSGEAAAQRQVGDWVEKWAAPFRDCLGGHWSEVVAEAHSELANRLQRGRFLGEEALEPYVARIVRGRSIARWRRQEVGAEQALSGAALHPPVDQLIDFADNISMGLVERELITDHLISCPLCVNALELARQPVVGTAVVAAVPLSLEGRAEATEESASSLFVSANSSDSSPGSDRAISWWAIVATLLGLAFAGGFLATFQELRQQIGGSFGLAQQVEQLNAERLQLVGRAEDAETRLTAADHLLASRGAFELRQGGPLLVLEPTSIDGESSPPTVELRSDYRGQLVLVLRADHEVIAEESILALDGPAGERLWSLNGLRRDDGAEGHVLLVPSSRLAAGRYTVELSSQPGAEPLASYYFEIRRWR